MEREEKQAWMDEILGILQASNPPLPKDKTSCKHGHSKINNIDKHGHCLTCVKNRAIQDKRKALGSASIWY